MKLRLNIIILIAAIFFINGCATTVRTYPGAQLPTERIAVLKGEWNEYLITSVCGNIQKVDGKNVQGDIVEILPGEHDLVVYITFIGPNMVINGIPQNFKINAEAGHTYIVDGNWNGGDNQIWIEDKQTGKIIAGKRPD